MSNWFLDKIKKMLGHDAVPATEEKAEVILEDRRMKISEATRERLNAMPDERTVKGGMVLPTRIEWPVVPYTPPKGVAPAKHVLTMDRAQNALGIDYNLFTGSGFPGFAYLTELTQLTEYRDMSERVAAEMTRKWIKFTSGSDEDRTKELKEIEAEFKRLGVRDLFRRAAELDGQMGRCQIFIDLGADTGPELARPLMVDKMKVGKGKLNALKIIEPISTYPQEYNSINPKSQEYYKPSIWYVMGEPVHASRLLSFISRPVPNYLKPSYNFSGISISQLAQPYVDYWFSTRDSVGKLLRNFSTSILKTNMSGVLAGGGADVIMTRAKMFSKMRDNQNLFLLDNQTEAFEQQNTPLAGLSQLQAQAQEHMASVAKTPLVILLGVSPTGLNASSDGEIRVFNDYVAEQQEKMFRPNLELLLKIVQLNLFGEVYEDIGFHFVDLYTLTEKDKAMVRASDAKAGVDYVAGGVIEVQEERTRLARNPDSGYDGLDLTKIIEKPVATVPGAPPDKRSVALKATEATKPGGGGGKASESPEKPLEPAKDSAELLPAFLGNQHTGPLGSLADSQHAIATMASSVAARATSIATGTGHKRQHERALQAHLRALDMQQAALDSPEHSGMNLVNEEYKKVHQQYIDYHRAEVATLLAKIDGWKGSDEDGQE